MKRVILLCAFLVCGLSAYAQEDEVTVTEEWFETRPVCFGRYVANVPKILQPVITEARLEDFTVTNLGPATQKDLDARIAERQGLMEAGGAPDDLPDTQFQFVRHDGGITALAYQEVYPPEWNYTDPRLGIETYLLSEGHVFEIKGMIGKATRDAQLATLFRIAHATRPRGMEEVPAEPGYCIQDGFVALKENIASLIGLSMRNEDVDSGFVFFADVRSGPGLIQNGYNWPPEAISRSVAGFDGTQVWGVQEGDNPDYRGYAGEFYGYRPSASGVPEMSLNIRTERPSAPPYDPAFSLPVAQIFWEFVVKSLRLRG